MRSSRPPSRRATTDRGPERRPAGGCRALAAHAAQRPALQRSRRVPPPRRRAAEPRGALRRLRRADRLRGRPRRRRRARRERGARDRPRRARGDPLRRHVPVTRAADALGDRPGGRPRDLRDPRPGEPAGRREPPGPLHGQRQLPHGRAGPVRDLHARELRSARVRGSRPADLQLPGGRRLLPYALGPSGAGRRVPLRRRTVLRRGAEAAARQRLRVRAGDHQARPCRARWA